MSKENSSKIDAETFMASLGNTNGDSSSHLGDLNMDEDSSSNEVEFIKELKINLDKHNCNLCCKGTFLLNRLLEFGGIINEENKFACDICYEGFRKRYLLIKHKKTHEKVILNENINGDAQIKTPKQRNIDTSSRLTCKICHLSYKNKGSLSNHFRNKHGNLKYACKICNKSFKNKDTQSMHFQNKHGNLKYSCKTCYESFKNKDTLSMHFRNKHGNLKYTCIECNIKVFTLEQYKYHLSTHPSSSKKTISCPACDTLFWQKSDFDKHICTVET